MIGIFPETGDPTRDAGLPFCGFSEIIRDEVLGPVGHDGYRDYAGDIHKSGTRLLTVINDVLDVTRLEGGLLTMGTAFIIVGLAVAAVFAYLALVQIRALTRNRT